MGSFSKESVRGTASTAMSRIAKLGGRGFMGQLNNWMTGARAALAKDGLKTTMWKLARHQEHGYLNESCKQVGTDEFGNEYFEDTSCGKLRGRDRWVIYNGDGNNRVFDRPFQASAVPPTWHAWLHQLDDRPPPENEKLDPCSANFVVPGSEASSIAMYDHVKPWRPNQTGAGHEKEYRQSGHWVAGNYRMQTYETWDGSVKKTLAPPNSNN